MRYSKAGERSARAKRETALARTELRQSRPFIEVGVQLPEIGRPLVAYADDGELTYKLPFPCVFRGNGIWSNLKHERSLVCKIVSWHYIA